MGIFTKLKGWVKMKFLTEARKMFDIKPISTEAMSGIVNRCVDAYKGNPDWVGEEIKTVNFAKTLCSETARLSTLNTKISITGSARANYLDEIAQKKIKKNLRKWVEQMCVYGAIILKPNGKGIDVVTPEAFTITNVIDGEITGCVFQETIPDRNGEKFFHRLEYHDRRDQYKIYNRVFLSESEGTLGTEIDISASPWADLDEEANIDNVDSNLFAFLCLPHANNVDMDSPVTTPLIADAMEELQDLDVAYSLNSYEIAGSKRTVLLDSDKLIMEKGVSKDRIKGRMGLPDYVRMVEGTGQTDFYQEINPTLNTTTRLEGINALLSQIGYKIGFSNGYFVFNEQQGIQTATGVEASQQRTIQFIADVRECVKNACTELIYALNAFADAYDLAPLGKYEVVYDFGDITENHEEDKARWWGYVLAGVVPRWKYFVMFEGMTEEEAKAMTDEALKAQVATQTLFSEE